MKPKNALLVLTTTIVGSTGLLFINPDNPFALACVVSSAMFWGYYFALWKHPMVKK